MALFQKGERPVGREKGTPNKRTVEFRGVIETAAREIGGAARLVEWIKEDPANERIFWSSMWIKLLPVQVTGSGSRGEIELNVKLSPEELARKCEERGLPLSVFGIDVPELDEQSNGNRDDKPPEGSLKH